MALGRTPEVTISPIRLRYQTIEFPDFDIHLRTLRDSQQFEDRDGEAAALGISSAAWPLFGVLWTSERVLAGLMAEREVAGLRILEVGCGTALASLVLNRREADITATDLHPEAQGFLDANTQLNQDATIPFVRTGWTDEDSGLGRFDLIIGSDLLYEAAHIDDLSAFVNQHAAAGCTVVLVDPGRGFHARFSKRMVALGFAHSQRPAAPGESEGGAFSGRILTYVRQTTPADPAVC